MVESTNYREATFYYYTGTGNSYRVTKWMAGAVRDAGVAVVTVCPIASAVPEEQIGRGETALLGLVMPTHGFTAPWAMLRFALRMPRPQGVQGVPRVQRVQRLPRRHKTHAMVVATRAGSKIGSIYTPGVEGSAIYLIALILFLKGYRIRGAAGVDMPTNWISLHPGLAPGTVAGIAARAETTVAGLMDIILSGNRRLAGWGNLVFGVLILPVSAAYMLVGRFCLGKLFFASDRCNGCGLCAEYCPNQAIRMRGSGRRRRPYWTFHCESCKRCMGFCPTQAVEASHLLAVGLYYLSAAIPMTALVAWLMGRAPLLGFLGGTPRLLLGSVFTILVLALAYPVLHFVLGIGWVNRFFTLFTLTHYYRRYREPGTRLKDLK